MNLCLRTDPVFRSGTKLGGFRTWTGSSRISDDVLIAFRPVPGLVSKRCACGSVRTVSRAGRQSTHSWNRAADRSTRRSARITPCRYQVGESHELATDTGVEHPFGPRSVNPISIYLGESVDRRSNRPLGVFSRRACEPPGRELLTGRRNRHRV